MDWNSVSKRRTSKVNLGEGAEERYNMLARCAKIYSTITKLMTRWLPLQV
jgi:hypothetical protein